MFEEVVLIGAKLNYQEMKSLLEEKNQGRAVDKRLRLPSKHELQVFFADKTVDKSLFTGIVYWVESGEDHEVSGVALSTCLSKTFSRTGSTLSVVFVR